MLDWKQITRVFVDMDGTLLDLHFDNYFWLEYVPAQYAKLHDLSLSCAKSELNSRYNAKSGRLEWYCVNYWSKELGLDIIQLKQDVSHKIALRPLAEEFLSSINQKCKKITLLTNAHPETLALKMSKIPLTRWFDRVISSHDLGFAKENVNFWPQLQKVENFNKTTSLLIDDSKAVLTNAANYGIGNLLAISQPDLQMNARNIAGFESLDSFSQIL